MLVMAMTITAPLYAIGVLVPTKSRRGSKRKRASIVEPVNSSTISYGMYNNDSIANGSIAVNGERGEANG